MTHGPAAGPAPAAGRLPRGRHRLSREQVAAEQRARTLRALAVTVARRGYADTTVADVLREARVSRATFYEQFASKADCFMQAYDEAAGIVLDGIGDALGATDPAGAERDPVDRALAAYLDRLADEPAFARVFLLEVYAAGREALARRAATQAVFADLVADLAGATTVEERFAAEAFVAATSALVTARLAADDPDGVRALRDPLAGLADRLLGRAGRCTHGGARRAWLP